MERDQRSVCICNVTIVCSLLFVISKSLPQACGLSPEDHVARRRAGMVQSRQLDANCCAATIVAYVKPARGIK